MAYGGRITKSVINDTLSSNSNWKKLGPRRGSIWLGRYSILLVNCCYFLFGRGGYFIRSQKPDPQMGYIIWEEVFYSGQCNILQGVCHIAGGKKGRFSSRWIGRCTKKEQWSQHFLRILDPTHLWAILYEQSKIKHGAECAKKNAEGSSWYQ